jgi:RND family efflux transporter MFP subunit
MPFIRSQLPLLASLGLLLFATSACSEKTTETAAAAPNPTSSTAPLPAAPNSRGALVVTGPLIVEHQLDLLAQRDGVVTKLLSEAGARVSAGDMLAQFDDRQLSADLEAARAKTRSTEDDLRNWEAEARVLQADYDRAQKMWEAQLITREQLEHAKFKAEADQWDVKRVEQMLVNARETERSLELELDKTRIRAPFSGIVARRYIRAGQQVAKGDRLFWVTAEGPLRIRFTLPEKFLGILKVGQSLVVTVPDFPAEHQHSAKVVELSRIVDPSSGTFDGMVELVGAAGPLRPGMSAVLQIDPRQ